MWLLAGQKAPDHSMIVRFRTGFVANACENLFYQMGCRLETKGELSKEMVFIDGTKLEACANIYTMEEICEKMGNNDVWTNPEGSLSFEPGLYLPILCG